MDGIQLNTRLSDQEMAKLNMQVDSFNKSITIEGRKVQRDLGKDDFLKLLITQLSNQDPTSPMENTQFIAQMAQFSSLEQMTNMNQEFAKMNSMLVSSQAVGTIGKTVDITLGDTKTTGVVEAVTYGANPQVRVNNMYYDMKQISAVYGE
ncbi:flagellar hook assembly protein FlgD [uncultured Treponema sp.]|uniref:flagellar hook assembly protein FlgD n=1 Tax=Treponema sp. TaxID=166 RepID=UPI0025E550BD|nr:flagellar hook assembly protein FlgD [uncultured Treponema sp.]MEE0353330.1 flagellar hook assembly protein FlgD [Treponema sp.]